jgi:hypothetical protein
MYLPSSLSNQSDSPRWLAFVSRNEEALANLANIRKDSPTVSAVVLEMTEIETSIKEEKGLGSQSSIFGTRQFNQVCYRLHNLLLQQWGGQNSVGYYVPQILRCVLFFGPWILVK